MDRETLVKIVLAGTLLYPVLRRLIRLPAPERQRGTAMLVRMGLCFAAAMTMAAFVDLGWAGPGLSWQRGSWVGLMFLLMAAAVVYYIKLLDHVTVRPTHPRE